MKLLTKLLAQFLNALTFGRMRKKAILQNTYEHTPKTSFSHQELIDLLGGLNNIKKTSSTLSKLRVEFHDKSLVNIQAIKKYPEVTGLISATNHLDIIIGNAAKIIDQQIQTIGSSNAY